MADNIATIVNFFRNKNLPDKVIAAILGNMQQESSFRTDALNGGEGAIGLAQWEGGRRKALQQYASDHNTSETDLKTQLNFMWDHELSSAPYNHILGEMNAAPSAGAAAAIWDQEYEVSSGSSRSERMANAESFASSHLSSAGVSQGQSSGGGGGAVPMSAGSAPATLTPAQQKAALLNGIGPLSSLLTSIPELKSLLDKAISSGQTAQEFQNAINNSQWYRTHSDSVRNGLIQQASDPATYQANLKKEVTRVSQVEMQLGVRMNSAAMTHLAQQSLMMGGWDAQTLQNAVGSLWSNTNGKNLAAQSGQAATIQQQLRQTASDYGLPATDYGIRVWTQKILSGQDTLDGNKQAALNQAKTMYAPFAKQLDAGQTMRQIADPYISAKANLLEVDPGSIDFTKDPLIKKALQGVGATAAGQDPTSTPLWQFEQQVKSDPRWNMTKNAHADTSALLETLGHDWGFSAA